MTVIEELDGFKSLNTELARNARQVIRKIDFLREVGKEKGAYLSEGILMENGGKLMIFLEQDSVVNPGLDLNKADNRILAVAHTLKQQDKKVVFVSKDINARLKADALKIEVSDYEKQKVDFSELFSGQREVEVDPAEIDEFHSKNGLIVERDARFAGFMPNEFAHLVDRTKPKHSAIGRFEEGMLLKLKQRQGKVYNLKTRNAEQQMAVELLLDRDRSFVTMIGQAGTGKTILALAAGLQMFDENAYDKIVVVRPIIPVGKELGFMPGSHGEKIAYWMQPVFDNLAILLNGKDESDHNHQAVEKRINEMLASGQLELHSLANWRGRSIHRQFIIVDEGQNMTPQEVKTVISRAAEGTKIVLTGDPWQIDNPYLDSSSNGLSYAVDRMKHLLLHGHITLDKTLRSGLAQAAAECL